MIRRFALIATLGIVPSCTSSAPHNSEVSTPREATPIELSVENPPSIRALTDGTSRAPTPEEFDSQLDKFGESWMYGHGMGTTIANVGTVVLFPPYALYLLGNAGLSLAGYQPVHVTDALPTPARTYVTEVYDDITSVPGRISAKIAGREFKEREKEDGK